MITTASTYSLGGERPYCDDTFYTDILLLQLRLFFYLLLHFSTLLILKNT